MSKLAGKIKLQDDLINVSKSCNKVVYINAKLVYNATYVVKRSLVSKFSGDAAPNQL